MLHPSVHGPAAQRARFSSNPPLKLIVIEDEGDPGTINNVGIEVEDTDAVVAATHRLAEQGLPSRSTTAGRAAPATFMPHSSSVRLRSRPTFRDIDIYAC